MDGTILDLEFIKEFYSLNISSAELLLFLIVCAYILSLLFYWLKTLKMIFFEPNNCMLGFWKSLLGIYALISSSKPQSH